jgi:hypothetical protein
MVMVSARLTRRWRLSYRHDFERRHRRLARRLVTVRRAACVAVVAARPGTFKMRPTVTYRADESLVSERMGPVFRLADCCLA